MISRVHQKLGTAGFIISIVALVAALGGGAYAAGGLTKPQEKQVVKIAKKYAGKPGANGAPGPAGSKGDAGAAGAAGKQGPEGKQGPKGEEGTEGKEGSPWTAGGKLPEEQTETGTWSFIAGAGKQAFPAVSFPIPLTAPLPGGQGAIHLVGFSPSNIAGVEFGGSAACKGSVIEPTAPPGALCIYLGPESELGEAKVQSVFQSDASTGGVGPAGSVIWFTHVETAGVFAAGSWAVTAG